MNPVAVLPQLASHLRVPDRLTPTQMCRALGCPLSALLAATLDAVDRLPPDPRAVLGTVLHKVVEDAAMGRVVLRGTPRESLRLHLDRSLADKEAQLVRTGLERYVPLRSVLRFTEYLRRVNRALQRAEPFVRQGTAPNGDRALFSGPRRAVAEQKFESAALNLAGRVDWWEEHGNEVSVRDLKTGAVWDGGGGIAPHVVFQLRLYGLLAAEARPGKRVRLFVDHEATEELPWGAAEEAETREQVEAIRRELPPGRVIETAHLARVGESCRWCDGRAHCGRYREEAPRLWGTTGLDFVPPQDTAGELAEPILGKEAMTVRLRDLAGRHVTVVGVRNCHGDLPALALNAKLWFFGLEARGSTKDVDGRYRHPTNFRELAMSPSERPAWRLKVLREV
jgi:hypothetical protein